MKDIKLIQVCTVLDIGKRVLIRNKSRCIFE